MTHFENLHPEVVGTNCKDIRGMGRGVGGLDLGQWWAGCRPDVGQIPCSQMPLWVLVGTVVIVTPLCLIPGHHRMPMCRSLWIKVSAKYQAFIFLLFISVRWCSLGCNSELQKGSPGPAYPVDPLSDIAGIHDLYFSSFINCWYSKDYHPGGWHSIQ